MIAILVYRNKNGEIENGIYTNVSDYRESLDCITFTILHNSTTARSYTIRGENLICFIPLNVKGNTYKAKKADLYNKALLMSYGYSVANWSYGEIATISEFFEKYGRRYGLLTEFHENAIC